MQITTPCFVPPTSRTSDALILALLGTLGFGGTPELLGAVLALFAWDVLAISQLSC